MKDIQFRKTSDIRKQHNIELIRRMRSGESLTSFDSRSSWYPPRPIIEKDTQEIARLYHSAAAIEDPAGESAERVNSILAKCQTQTFITKSESSTNKVVG